MPLQNHRTSVDEGFSRTEELELEHKCEDIFVSSAQSPVGKVGVFFWKELCGQENCGIRKTSLD